MSAWLSAPHGTIIADRQGFSLIELIMVLVLMGILGLMAGFGITQLSNGFLFAKQASSTAGTGQLAMLRISKEFRKILVVKSSSSQSITFDTVTGFATNGDPVPSSDYTLSLNGTNLMLNNGTSNDILADNVKKLSLKYYAAYDGNPAAAWSTGNSHIIEISLTLAGPDAINPVFTTRIVPRNID